MDETDVRWPGGRQSVAGTGRPPIHAATAGPCRVTVMMSFTELTFHQSIPLIPRSRRHFARAARLALAVLVAACQPAAVQEQPIGRLDVQLAAGRLDAPDTVDAGWTRVHVSEDGGGHIAAVLRLPAAFRPEDVSAFVQAFDTARNTPAGAVSLGGPEVGSEGEVIMSLEPGLHLVLCLRRNAEGHRHAMVGEARPILVRRSDKTAPAPIATLDIGLADFAFTGRDTLPAGRHLVRITNSGQHDHLLRLARLSDSTSLREWLSSDEPASVAHDVSGLARISPGQFAYVEMQLEPGRYVAFCLLPIGAPGRTHVDMGMFREMIVVEGHR